MALILKLLIPIMQFCAKRTSITIRQIIISHLQLEKKIIVSLVTDSNLLNFSDISKDVFILMKILLLTKVVLQGIEWFLTIRYISTSL